MEMLQELERGVTALGKPKTEQLGIVRPSLEVGYMGGEMPVCEQKWCFISLKVV